ncbi:unnamed protein product [Malus baccata var. baccata]|uniref:COI1 F-box domain-containing protein n=1 Tax=Malus baccata TaxID=106549 RepID=A0A540LF56_MALBA|nr:hypothetical protein C1H46_029395 [Malus baccata]
MLYLHVPLSLHCLCPPLQFLVVVPARVRMSPVLGIFWLQNFCSTICNLGIFCQKETLVKEAPVTKVLERVLGMVESRKDRSSVSLVCKGMVEEQPSTRCWRSSG